jgi:hypothetical protein
VWRGRDIVKQVADNYFAGKKKALIREAWDRFCRDG